MTAARYHLHRNSEPQPAGECRSCQQFYRIRAVCAMLDVSEKTIRRMIANGQLKAKRIGGSIRIPHEELAKIIREY